MEKYIELAKTDRVAITAIFNAMTLTERMTAVLYLLDNMTDVSHPTFKEFMIKENEEYLRCIKEANRPGSNNRPRSKVSQAEDDVLLVEEAVRLYYIRTGSKPPVVEVIETPKEKIIETIEEIKNFYYILIGR